MHNLGFFCVVTRNMKLLNTKTDEEKNPIKMPRLVILSSTTFRSCTHTIQIWCQEKPDSMICIQLCNLSKFFICMVYSFSFISLHNLISVLPEGKGATQGSETSPHQSLESFLTATGIVAEISPGTAYTLAGITPHSHKT